MLLGALNTTRWGFYARVCVLVCDGGSQEIRPHRILCDRLLAESWSSIPLIHPPGIVGWGSCWWFLFCQQAVTKQPENARYVHPSTHTSLQWWTTVFDKWTKRRRLEKFVNQLSERGHMMGFYRSFLVVRQPSENNQNSVWSERSLEAKAQREDG